MRDLLAKINETINNSLANSNEEAALQIKILKSNINTLFAEYEQQNSNETIVEDQQNEVLLNNNLDVLDQDDMKTILIVDDSNIIRNYLERIFINEYNIATAVDGNDAVLKIQENQNKYNIILLDLVMPKADGFFVLEYLSKYNIDIPVIIISGDTSKESVNRAFDYGVVDMIKKPFDADIIKEKINRYIK